MIMVTVRRGKCGSHQIFVENYPGLVIVYVTSLVVPNTATFQRHHSRGSGKEQEILLSISPMNLCSLHQRKLIMLCSSLKKKKGGWMNMPQGNPNIPRGLEYLTMIDQLLVHQKVELLEAFTGFETQNKYTIKNSMGQKVYYAVEDSDCLTRNCCGPLRPFDMKILDNYKTEVIHLNRPLACDSCWFPCCLQRMEVSSPPGTVIGSIEQEWSILTPQFNIKNSAGDTVLKIEGPICTFSICGDVEFKVLSRDGGTQVGKISKQWAGLLREAFTDADYFGITFPMDLDVKMKAVMIGACFLIDVMFFEKQGNRESDRPGMF
ncbi:Phospholipid scramblase 2 [Cryptotermes secundus]|uniref:Phospholipid scramblase n=1 Tax=Cryptotermes secundus TaxID=105785 RepID=A0A2J7R026_9NEOP|nr:phospholipid scramblase 2 isoform X4 [Cryptotermes secundus]XP_033607239.1 phospholipid scramblase 2 isoform X4 [Cryptotermes secundus]PNF34188.1 Phospholipid scramblase 2 [Cryptotermes secundus]PNF34191.1 Phospholipid scramblase 2 [Cryptotermes secundus]PNF34193.1 Phospholipid scramblase 2 [Cryptotermes secundus]PNF34196.1 Phospholipid scramblase 2 [Cryptotermes secundus]